MDIGDIKRIVVKDGDLLVVRTPAWLTQEQCNNIRADFEGFFAKFNAKAIVLVGGMTLDILSREEVTQIMG
jgi:hypothetical protein